MRTRSAIVFFGTMFLLSCASKKEIIVQPKFPISTPDNKELEGRLSSHRNPRLANQIQICCGDTRTRKLLDQLSFYDLVIVDAEMVRAVPEYLGAEGNIRRENPNAVLLAYFSAGDINVNRTSPVINGFNRGVDPSWYLKDVKGKPVPLFKLASGKWTLAQNPTTQIRNYLPEYLNQVVLEPGLFDGIFYDWMNPKISWLNHRRPPQSGPIDIDQDGKADDDNKVDRLWKQGRVEMLVRSREVFLPGSLIVGNNGWNSGPAFAALLNGAMIEDFLGGAKRNSKQLGWGGLMSTYFQFQLHSIKPKIFIIQSRDNDEKNFSKMRFALASTLMFDGYFCFSNDSGGLSTTRWYDEYSVDIETGRSDRNLQFKGYLGKAVSEAYSIENPKMLLKDRLLSNPQKTQKQVWRRDFEHGIVLVNPTEQKHTIRLGGTFRKIHGIVDPKFNDGSTVSEITMVPQEGLILLRL